MINSHKKLATNPDITNLNTIKANTPTIEVVKSFKKANEYNFKINIPNKLPEDERQQPLVQIFEPQENYNNISNKQIVKENDEESSLSYKNSLNNFYRTMPLDTPKESFIDKAVKVKFNQMKNHKHLPIVIDIIIF